MSIFQDVIFLDSKISEVEKELQEAREELRICTMERERDGSKRAEGGECRLGGGIQCPKLQQVTTGTQASLGVL